MIKKTAGKLRLGIVGCGAIGSRIALSATRELKDHFMMSALYDIDPCRSSRLAGRLKTAGRIVKNSVDALIASSDVVVECVNTPAAEDVILKAVKARKKVLVMSVGRLMGRNDIIALARRLGSPLVLPSGAIAGLDAIRAASLAGLTSLTITTTKPPSGFAGNVYLSKAGISLDGITEDKVLFEGTVKAAVAKFPQNINVAAALSLAADGVKVKVRIVASASSQFNTHEIYCKGRSGTIRTVTENVPCPDNPKTSYLAVLSGVAALKQLAN